MIFSIGLDRRELDERERHALEVEKRKAVASVGLPAKDLRLILAGEIQETAAVRAARDPSQPLIVMSGGPGVGKTTAGSVALADLLFDDDSWMPTGTPGGTSVIGWRLLRTAVFVTASAISRWKVYDHKEVWRLAGADRLTIDDAGAEFAEARFMATFDELVNERYANRRRTVITTNLPVGDFRERYGERIADRLLECGRFVALGRGSLRGPR